MQNTTSALEIRIHGSDGSVQTFVQEDAALADSIMNEVQPGRLFATSKVVIAGNYSLTAFVPSKLLRIDFVREGFACWGFPAGIIDSIELSETEFREKTHLDDEEHLEERAKTRVPGEFAVGFLDIEMVGGQHLYLAVEFVVGLPAERLQRINLLLSAPSIHFRMREGGIGVLNLGNLVRVTILPGPSEAPANSWPAHHKPKT
jgi:hypothetical protein